MTATAANPTLIGQATPANGLPPKAGNGEGATAAARLLGGISFADLAAISLSQSADIGLTFTGIPPADRQTAPNREAAPYAPSPDAPNTGDDHEETDAATSSVADTGPVYSAPPQIASQELEQGQGQGQGQGHEQRQGQGQRPGQSDFDLPRATSQQTSSTVPTSPAERAAAPTDRPAPTERPTPAPPSTLKAQITDAPQDLQPKPGAPLNARTAIAAQAAAEKPASAPPETGGGNRQGPNAAIAAHTLARHAHGPTAANGAQTRGRAVGKPSEQTTQVTAPSQAQATVDAAQARNTLLSTLGRAAQTGPRPFSPVLPDQAAATGGSLAGSHASPRAADVSPAFKPRPAMPLRLVANQVSVQIQKAVAQGTDRISIQLKPAELGRVDIRLDVGPDGRVAATISTDRPDTLELLQRDARTLQNSLQDSGLRTDSDSLSFQLRSQSNAMNRETDGESADADADNDATTDTSTEAAARPGHVGQDRVDIEV